MPETGPDETFLKRVIDLTLASGLWTLSLPLVGLIAVAIKLDSPGPVFFAQKRPGLGGRYFRLYKFRTMRTNSQQLFDELPEHLKAEFAAYGKIRHDPRVTRVGRLLRRMSLDELPQLWNVVRGDMSLVGPRPYLRRQMRDLAGRKEVILRIRPGLTGLWQVTGRNDIPFRRRLIMDIWYVRNQSPRVDAVILLRTVPVVLRAEGAY